MPSADLSGNGLQKQVRDDSFCPGPLHLKLTDFLGNIPRHVVRYGESDFDLWGPLRTGPEGQWELGQGGWVGSQGRRTWRGRHCWLREQRQVNQVVGMGLASSHRL